MPKRKLMPRGFKLLSWDHPVIRSQSSIISLYNCMLPKVITLCFSSFQEGIVVVRYFGCVMTKKTQKFAWSQKTGSSHQLLPTSLVLRSKTAEIFFRPHFTTPYLLSVSSPPNLYGKFWSASGWLCPLTPSKLYVSEHK